MPALGLDLGTTNTAAAIDGAVVVPPIPSVVAYMPSGATVVGEVARRRRMLDATNTIYSSKRLIGRAWHSWEAKTFKQNYPHEIMETKDDLVAFLTRHGVKTPADVAADITTKVCELAGIATDTMPVNVTVPTSFPEACRDATVQAVRAAGFSQVSYVEEPIATLCAYQRAGTLQQGKVVIYDLGGGTFDVAVVDTASPELKVLANGGDPYLGGDDIDRAIAKWAAEKVLEVYGWDLRSERQTRDRLVLECEQAKIRLLEEESVPIDLSQVDPAAPAAVPNFSLTREHCDRLVGGLVQRTFGICDEVLDDARLKARDICAVYLAGGATRMAAVQRGVQLYFGTTAVCGIEPMHVVAIGASLAPCAP